MITILNQSQQPLAVLDNYQSDGITEVINGEYTFTFTVVLDEDGKSEYIVHQNLVEADGKLFEIFHTARTRDQSGSVLITAECWHVSYALRLKTWEAGFMQAGTPTQLLNMILAGTGFTVDTVQFSGIVSVDMAEEGVTARALLLELAAQTGGELYYDNYTVSLLTRRGQDRGVTFALGKNILGITKDVNITSGEVVTAYQINIVELNSLPEFQGLEYFELGDTVQIVDPELGINEPQRIVKYTYSPKLKMNSTVEISNTLTGVQDQLVKIVKSSVGKDKYYYGTRIGPEEGFEAIRWDKRARGVFNADKLALQKGNGSGSSWTDVLRLDSNGDAWFSGTVEASRFVGGSIQIGTSFSVDSTGHMKAVGAEFSGEITASIINGGQINGTSINGGTITGSTIRTSESGSRIVMNASGLGSFDSSGRERVTLGFNTEAGMAGFVFRSPSESYVGQIYSTPGGALHIIANDELFLRSFGITLFQGTVKFDGIVDFSDATVIGL